MDGLIYKVIRSRRRTIQIIVKDCNVVVRAPLRCDDSRIEKFVAEKAGWIEACVNRQKGFMERVSAFVKSNELPLFGDCVMLDAALNPLVVKNFYLKQFDKLKRVFDDVSKRCGLSGCGPYSSNAKTLWGTCDSRNVIRLNMRLSALPLSLVEYVIVHELAHTVHHNHSKVFWLTVGRIMPDYAKRRKELKRYSWVLEMYR